MKQPDRCFAEPLS